MPEPTVHWVGGLDGRMELIDQTLLPTDHKVIACRTVDEVWEAIRTLRVRGAPAIGVAAAMGVVVGIQDAPDDEAAVLEAVARTCKHLATSRPTAVNLFWALDRMKRVAAETTPPTLIGYDETAFASKLFYDQLDPQAACDIFEKNRQLTAEVLRRLPDDAFDRTGNHNEHGRMTLAELVETYVGHLDHHLKFIDKKRAMV